MTFELTPEEATLARAIESARRQTFDPKRRPLTAIRAEAIRRFFLGLPVVLSPGAVPRVVELPSAGVRCKYALIEGDLDLQDLSGPDGSSLPPLALEACVIPGAIHLSRSRFRHLSLYESRLVWLRGRHLVIDGPVDLRYISSAETDRLTGARGFGRCWIEMPGLRTGGAFGIGGARLAAPEKRDGLRPAHKRYALDLEGAQIGGPLRMLPPGSALGGVTMAGADIRGDVRCDGALLTALEGFAFNAQTSTVRGAAALRNYLANDGAMVRFRANGEVNFIGAQIADSLSLEGASLKGSDHGALAASNVRIGGPLLMGERIGEGAVRFEAEGSIFLEGARIDGDLELQGASLKGSSQALWAPNIVVGGKADLCASGPFEFQSEGQINLTRGKIGGDLNMNGAELSAPESALLLVDSEIAGSALLTLTAKGEITLAGASVARELNMDHAILTGVNGRAVAAFDSKIGTDFNLRNAKVTGVVSTVDAEIGDSLCLHNTEFSEQGGHIGLLAQGLVIGRKLILTDIRFRPAGSLRPVALSLVGGKVGGIFKVNHVSAESEQSAGRVVADLQGLHVEDLDDDGGEGWGDNIALRLDGFVYNHLVKARPKQGVQRWRRRARWLGLQYDSAAPTLIEYSPQPYDRLVQVLRASGFFEDAQRIASLRLAAERKLRRDLLSPFAWAYEKLFDYGLSPSRAIATLIAFILIGWLGVFVAQTRLSWPTQPRDPPILVIDTDSVSSVAMVDPKTGRAAHVMSSVERGGRAVEEIACGHEIEPLLYAVDVFVPGIDLHQERRCAISNRDDARPWRILKAIYAILGWLVSSLTVLTVSGILRRHAEL